MKTQGLFLPDETATLAFGQSLAVVTGCHGVITLSGDLGTGKTTLSRGLIRACGHTGPVKSPTFTIVEPYELGAKRIMHFDLYRLEDPEELEFLGFRDYLDERTLCLIEWPEKGAPGLPPADLALTLRYQGRAREVTWAAATRRGETLSRQLAARHRES